MFSFKTDNSFKVNDAFDLIITIHKFFGVSYYGYDSDRTLRQYLLYLFPILYQICIYIAIIWLNKLSFYNLIANYRDIFANTGGKSFLIDMIISICISITNSIVYSLKGKQLKELIERLRKLAQNYANNREVLNKKLKPMLYIVIIFHSILFFCFVPGFVPIAYKINFYWPLISEFYSSLFIHLTDFYVIYFTNYIVIIQELFNNKLKHLYESEITLTSSDVKNLKKQFFEIQSLINSLNNILSPLLLIIFGYFTYQGIVIILLTFRALTNANDYIFPSIISLAIIIIRLCTICFCAEKINNQVIENLFFIFKY
jgi:hypothetical protein